MLGAVVVNYNTAALSERCVESLLAAPLLARIVVLDNASDPDDRAQLMRFCARAGARVSFVASESNLGFAAACNRGIAQLLTEPVIQAVLLANSDAVVEAGAVRLMAQALDSGASMVGARVMSDPDRTRVDSLGIAMYSSLLASNRQSLEDPLFGPTGGLALYARKLLEDLLASHDHLFDEQFFCYAEDTDLALRALLLGHRPSYVEAVAAHHRGQASSGGGFNDFVLYHGIRNSIWMLIKGMPASTLLRRLHLVLALHVGIMVRHSLRGKAGVVWRLYRDALRGLPAMWRKRRRIKASRRIAPEALEPYIGRNFYERDYLRRAWRELWRGRT